MEGKNTHNTEQVAKAALPNKVAEKKKEIADLEVALLRAERSVGDMKARTLAGVEAELEVAPVSVGVTEERAGELYASLGFRDRMAAVKEKIEALAKRTGENISDARTRRIIKKTDYTVNRSPEKKLEKRVAALSEEEIRRTPELIASAKETIVQALERYESAIPYRPEDSPAGLEDNLSLFSKHPGIQKEILSDQRILAMQKKYLTKMLWHHHGGGTKALVAMQKMHMDPELAREVVVEVLEKNAEGAGRRDSPYLTDATGILDRFTIDSETRKRIGAVHLANLFDSYPIRKTLWSVGYLLSEKEEHDLLEENRSELQKAMFDAAVSTLKTSGNADSLRVLFDGSFDQIAIQKDFRDYCKQRPELLSEIMKVRLTRGDALHDPVYAPIKDIFGEEAYEAYLQTEDAKASAREGIFSSIIGSRIGVIRDYMRRFGFTMQEFASDPRLLATVREHLESRVNFEANDWKWSEHILTFFEIPISEVRDVLAKRAAGLIKKGSAIGYEILDSLELSPEDRIEISQIVFGTPDKAEVLEVYFSIGRKIDQSPSQEIQRLKKELLEQILTAEDPEGDYKKIEAIFIKNNVPTFGKVYGVFETLHSKEVLTRKIKKESSPVLQSSSPRMRSKLFYQDLLAIHIQSGNRSLKEYAEVLGSGEVLLARFEAGEVLTPSEQEAFSFFLGKMETLLSKSALDGADDAFAPSQGSFEERLSSLKENLKVKEGQRLLQRVEEMYLKPAGVGSFEELLLKMQEAKHSADERGRALAGSGRPLTIESGNFLKGVDREYITNILQNGSVAKEFLGSASSSDSTPYDTDISKVLEEDAMGGFKHAVHHSLARGYGELLFALKDRGQYQMTKKGELAKPQQGKFELFESYGDRHYGIRTGFPTTEIDFMILTGEKAMSEKEKNNLYFEIAKNGFYIPVTDGDGTVIFTPQMYDQYRTAFSGLSKFDGAPIAVEKNTTQKVITDVREMEGELREDAVRIKNTGEAIREQIQSSLSTLGVTLRSEQDSGILGAELSDIGSTGRSTNMLGDFDYDYSLRLDTTDLRRGDEIAEKVKASMTFEKDDSHTEAGYYQLRAKGVTAIGEHTFEKPIDIDIGFGRKADLKVYGTHDSLRDKLSSIKKFQGEDAYGEVLANIVLAKKVLKEGGAYKKFEHGGLGGVGVENWILSQGGSIEKAFRSFKDAAYENGSAVSFERFKGKYKILDAGINVKFNNHDDFVQLLKQNGYEAMLKVIDEYLEK